ncbi:thiamine-phosphate synthase family protein [Natronoarchaeum rubrum]|uniref:thiamine-phosphate synthase family protein n=1 Tax=Natronoarchaeum rubrum TaxID=755311 RepID=UPI002112A9CC|nr:thiamine-phosphate synthase family protein [Natronoarchaeum rubrum]
MSLVLPSEIVVERFVPTARAMLAAALDERGFTQQEIADRIGVTQAAVSNLVNGNVAVEERFSEDPRMIETIERIADGFDEDRMDGVDAMAELLALVEAFEDRGPICAAHEEAMPELEGLGCDLCVRGTDSEVLAERDVLASVRRAARLLAGTDAMVEHVPNVGTNVGMALPDAADPTDVAAIPGRIYRMRGSVEVPANPEFGASEHVARTVLAARSVDPDARAALNVATSDELLAAARERGIEPLEFDPEYEDRGEHLREAMATRGEVPPVLFHRGAFGIEPVTFVLGRTAVEAAELAVDLAERATGGHET